MREQALRGGVRALAEDQASALSDGVALPASPLSREPPLHVPAWARVLYSGYALARVLALASLLVTVPIIVDATTGLGVEKASCSMFGAHCSEAYDVSTLCIKRSNCAMLLKQYCNDGNKCRTCCASDTELECGWSGCMMRGWEARISGSDCPRSP